MNVSSSYEVVVKFNGSIDDRHLEDQSQSPTLNFFLQHKRKLTFFRDITVVPRYGHEVVKRTIHAVYVVYRALRTGQQQENHCRTNTRLRTIILTTSRLSRAARMMLIKQLVTERTFKRSGNGK